MNELYDEKTVLHTKREVDEWVQVENLTGRVLTINKEINEDILETVSEHILKWNREDSEVIQAVLTEISKYVDPETIDYKAVVSEYTKPITLKLSTVGGSVVDGLGLIDIIQNSATPIIGINMAKCYSMGAYMLSACHLRYSMPNASILFHDGNFGDFDTTNKVLDYAKYVERLHERMKNIVLENTEITEEVYEANKRTEFYMFPEEAIRFGVIDGIIGKDIQLSDIL